MTSHDDEICVIKLYFELWWYCCLSKSFPHNFFLQIIAQKIGQRLLSHPPPLMNTPLTILEDVGIDCLLRSAWSLGNYADPLTSLDLYNYYLNLAMSREKLLIHISLHAFNPEIRILIRFKKVWPLDPNPETFSRAKNIFIQINFVYIDESTMNIREATKKFLH